MTNPEYYELDFQSYITLLAAENQDEKIAFLYNQEILKNITIKYDEIRFNELIQVPSKITQEFKKNNINQIIDGIKNFYKSEKERIRNSRFHKYDIEFDQGSKDVEKYELGNKIHNADISQGKLTSDTFNISGPFEDMKKIFNIIAYQDQIITSLDSNQEHQLYVIYSFIEYVLIIIKPKLEELEKIQNEVDKGNTYLLEELYNLHKLDKMRKELEIIQLEIDKRLSVPGKIDTAISDIEIIENINHRR